MPDSFPRQLVDLGTGVYTVSTVCRILPGMTPRKVHYWLNTDLLSEPIRRGRRGHPTLLSYRQILEIRTVQHLRDDLDFSLGRVRDAFSWILDRLFRDEELRFAKGVDGELVARYGSEQTVIPGGQGVLEGTIPELNEQITRTRRDWARGGFDISGFDWIVTEAHVQAGAPTIRGTRIETALIARLAGEEGHTTSDVADILDAYPHLNEAAVADAFAFEGVPQAA